MRVVELWHYPVKSMQGHRVERIGVDEMGFAGDRRWAIVDVRSGKVLTARRSPELLMATPDVSGDAVVVRHDDGRTFETDEDLSAWLGQDVRLDAATAGLASTYETPIDPETEQQWVAWQGPAGSFHDSARTQVSLVSMLDVGDWELRRFRHNVVFVGPSADRLVGCGLEIGSAALDVVKQIDRCVMVTRPQPGGLGRDLDVLRTVIRERANMLGVGALVTATGSMAVGDEIVVTTR